MSLTSSDRPLLGIGLMLAFCAVIPIGDGLAKLLGQVVPLAQLAALRYVFQLGLLGPLALLSRRDRQISDRAMRLLWHRSWLHVSGILMMFSALYFLPLADAVAIAFVMPFIMLLLSHFVMGEQVGWRRFAASAVGFAGTLMVIQPAFANVGWPAFLPIGVAVSFSLFMMVTRQIAQEVDPIVMQAVSGGMALLLLAPFFFGVALLGIQDAVPMFDLVWPARDLWWPLILMGVTGTFSHLMMSWALRFAPAATLAPMQYLEIPFATLVGYAMFGDLPNPLAVLGIVVTIAAGLYIIWRERAMSAASSPVGP